MTAKQTVHSLNQLELMRRWLIAALLLVINAPFDIYLLTASRRLCFLLYAFLSLLVCQQDLTKSTEKISMKRGWGMGLSPEYTPLKLVVDPGISCFIIVIKNMDCYVASLYE